MNVCAVEQQVTISICLAHKAENNLKQWSTETNLISNYKNKSYVPGTQIKLSLHYEKISPLSVHQLWKLLTTTLLVVHLNMHNGDMNVH